MARHVKLDDDTHANKPTWTNAQGKSIFAHGPFWYIGDLSSHPVETGYRGVTDCPRDADEPGTDCVYTASKNGREPVPVLSTAPCGAGGAASTTWALEPPIPNAETPARRTRAAPEAATSSGSDAHGTWPLSGAEWMDGGATPRETASAAWLGPGLG